MASSSNLQNDNPVRVFLLIDNRLLRDTLVRLLQNKPGLHLIGEGSFSDWNQAGHSYLDCDVLVLDHLRALAQIALQSENEPQPHPTVHRMLIGMEEDEDHFILGVRYGISAYLPDRASADEVVTAIRKVALGEAVCPPQLCLSLFRYVSRTLQAAQAWNETGDTPSLTARQHQLITLVATGLSNKEIAARLHLSEFTVRNHLHRIMKLFHAESRYEAVEAFRLTISAKPS